VGHDPADRVHRFEAPEAIRGPHAAKPSTELGPGESKLLDERVGRGPFHVRSVAHPKQRRQPA
jgi:hypothetical protein